MDTISVPSYANVLNEKLKPFLDGEIKTDLKESQVHGIALASAFAANSNSVVSSIVCNSHKDISRSTLITAKYAAVVIDMKFDQKQPIFVQTEITPDKSNAKYSRKTYMSPDNTPDKKNNNGDDPTFQLYLLAASYINDFDRYIEIKEKLIVVDKVSKINIYAAINIAAIPVCQPDPIHPLFGIT